MSTADGIMSLCAAVGGSYIGSIEYSPKFSWGFVSEDLWASLMAQLVKNPPAMRETWVRPLGWEDPLEKGYATHASILGLPWWLSW